MREATEGAVMAEALKKQRRDLWKLLDNIDTLDDACREDDTAFRRFVRKHLRARFRIWNPDSDVQMMRPQKRVAAWLVETLGAGALEDAAERSLRAAEEVIELAQACGVSAETIHRLVDYVFARPVGQPGQEIGGSLLTLYSTAEALDIDADAALEVELARAQQPEVMERVRRRQAEKREALIGSLDKDEL